MSIEPNSAVRLQHDFAAYLRGTAPLAPQLDPARGLVYRRLFFNNVFGLLSQAFPISATCVPAEVWRRWVEQFIQRHRAATPLFHELPAEFLQFATNCAEMSHTPAIIELLQYEYAETVLQLSDIELPPRRAMPDAVRLSPIAMPLAYRFAVHRIAKTSDLPQVAPEQPTLLLVWRNRAYKVQFQQLSIGAMQLALSAQQGAQVQSLPSAAQALVESWWQADILVEP